MILNMMATDPEFGIGSKKNGMLPAPLFLPNKENSKPMRWMLSNNKKDRRSFGNAHSINSDGFNCEMQVGQYIFSDGRAGFNPASCMKHQLDCIERALVDANNIAKENKLSILVGDLIPIDPSCLDKAPKECWMTGCNPTLNAKTCMMMEVMPNYKEDILKYGVPLGGHVHFITPPVNRTGNMSKDIELGAEFVKFASSVALIPMLLLGWNKQRAQRYKLLGIGNFRLPSHGGLEMKDFSGAALGAMHLFALQYGLCRVAFNINTSYPQMKKKIMAAAPFEKIEEAVMEGSKRKLMILFKKVASIVRNTDLNTSTNPYIMSSNPNSGFGLNRENNLLEFMFENEELFVCDDVELGWGGLNQFRTQDKGLESSLDNVSHPVPLYNGLLKDREKFLKAAMKFNGK